MIRDLFMIVLSVDVLYQLTFAILAILLACTFLVAWRCMSSLDRRDRREQEEKDARLLDEYMNQPMGQIPDEDTEEVIRRVL